MKKKIKCILAFLISIIICFSVFPISIYASNDCGFSPDSLSVNYTYSSDPWSITKGTYGQFDILDLSCYSSFKVEKCNVVSVTFNLKSNLYFTFSNSPIYLSGSTEDNKSVDLSCSDFTYTNNSLSAEFVVTKACTITWLRLRFFDVSYTCSSNTPLVFSIKSIDSSISTETQGLLNKLSSFFSSLFEKLTSGFDNIGNWFSQLGDKIKSFFSDLTDSIKSFFSELGNNLKEWFSNIGDWFAELGNNIKQWFVDIGDRIGGFFTTLWNRIWWGNENGESEYDPPVIDNKLNDILDTLDDYQIQLKGTIDTIGSAADSVSSYISTGTELVNGIIGVAGAGFTALIVFGIVFVLVRKVVGR